VNISVGKQIKLPKLLLPSHRNGCNWDILYVEAWAHDT